MDNKNYLKRLKEIIKEKDNRFWLMIFIILSTSTIFILWAINLDKIFLNSSNSSTEPDNINVVALKEDANQAFVDFMRMIEKNKELDKNTSSSTEELDELDLEKIKDALNRELSSSSTNISNNKIDLSSSSDPIISYDLDNSEQEIVELKRRIQELEGALKN